MVLNQEIQGCVQLTIINFKREAFTCVQELQCKVRSNSAGILLLSGLVFNLYYFPSISKFAQQPTTACCRRGYEEGLREPTQSQFQSRFIGLRVYGAPNSIP